VLTPITCSTAGSLEAGRLNQPSSKPQRRRGVEARGQGGDQVGIERQGSGFDRRATSPSRGTSAAARKPLQQGQRCRRLRGPAKAGRQQAVSGVQATPSSQVMGFTMAASPAQRPHSRRPAFRRAPKCSTSSSLPSHRGVRSGAPFVVQLGPTGVGAHGHRQRKIFNRLHHLAVFAALAPIRPI